MNEKDTIDQAPELFDQAEPVAREIHPALAPAIQQVQQVPVQTSMVPQAMSYQELLTFAVVNDKVHLLKELQGMETAKQDRDAMREFQQHFAEMQKDYKPVKRGSTNKQFNSVYADINDIMAVYGPILAKHGFSATWEEAMIPDQAGWKLVTSLITGYGHTKRASFPCPPPSALGVNESGNEKGANPLQRQGIQTAYGRRQSFTSNAGIILTDEDQDGGSFEDGVKIGQTIQLIREAKTQSERKAVYIAAISRTDLDEREKGIVAAESKKRNKELVDAGVRE